MSLVDGVLLGQQRAVARACRMVDDRVAGYRELLARLHPHTGQAWVVGVTGAPGAGKSTLTDALVSRCRARGERVGVVAVDPSSPFTGGAILGDRIRMQRHFEDPEVFIRSLATRGALGGLSRSADDVVSVLDAWGAQIIIVETVGVGQDELEVASSAHSTVVVMAPGMGDDVQAIKAGLLECADVFVVNKADRPGADATVRDLESVIALGHLSLAPQVTGARHSAAMLLAPSADPDGDAGGDGGAEWTPSVQRCVALRQEGIDAVAARLGEHRTWLGTPPGHARRRQRARQRLLVRLREELLDAVISAAAPLFEELLDAVERRELDPHAACARVLEYFSQGPPESPA